MKKTDPKFLAPIFPYGNKIGARKSRIADGNLVIDTPPDPRTVATSITLDPLEWIRRFASHIQDPGGMFFANNAIPEIRLPLFKAALQPEGKSPS